MGGSVGACTSLPPYATNRFRRTEGVGGCFWGPQILFDRVEGVVATSVGYTQGGLERPNYDSICGGSTGHTEAVQVYYDEKVVTYEKLLAEFWGHIDPTVRN